MRRILSSPSRRPAGARTTLTPLFQVAAAVCLACSSLTWSVPVAAQQNGPERERATTIPSLASLAPALNDRLVAIERAQSELLAALLREEGTVNEEAVRTRLLARVLHPPYSGARDAEAERSLAVLGPRLATVLTRVHQLHRDVVATYIATAPGPRRQALDALVARYRSQPPALPDAPKDMTILYDHPYTSFVPPTPPETEPHRELRHPVLTGVLWSMHWYELAVFEPLEKADASSRAQALATVAERFERKLSGGEPLDGYPTQLPLAPAIAPGLVALHDRTASIVDNLDMMLDVMVDTLTHARAADRRRLLDEILTEFTDRPYRCVQTDEWIVTALRHSIFDQGGFALATMSGYERNAAFGGHGQHYAVKRAPPACDPE